MNLDRAREIARLALRNLEANQQRIDDLNVYPVPDGDTGTNLTLTVTAIVAALEKSTAEGHEAVARELSRAALMGARGNSGVIFSQIVRGFADVLGERDPIDELMVARAFRSASDAAYRAVRRPVEGTMLTVIREMAEAAEAATLADIDAVRTALLRAVSHDLRTPLASIKAMISGLRDTAVKWTDDQLGEALETVDHETDRLNRLVGNLLDASRLQIGALAVGRYGPYSGGLARPPRGPIREGVRRTVLAAQTRRR